MTTEPYPAFIRDNPIMQGAFASFMDWIWRQDAAHEAFCDVTGHAPMARGKTPLDAAIDDATGFSKAYAAAFAKWAIDTQWGVEGRDDQDETKSAQQARRGD